MTVFMSWLRRNKKHSDKGIRGFYGLTGRPNHFVTSPARACGFVTVKSTGTTVCGEAMRLER